MTSGISVLTKTLEKDIEDLHVIESGMAHLAPSAADNGSTQASNSSNLTFHVGEEQQAALIKDEARWWQQCNAA
jgi:hypothetical protein